MTVLLAPLIAQKSKDCVCYEASLKKYLYQHEAEIAHIEFLNQSILRSLGLVERIKTLSKNEKSRLLINCIFFGTTSAHCHSVNKKVIFVEISHMDGILETFCIKPASQMLTGKPTPRQLLGVFNHGDYREESCHPSPEN